MSDSQGEKTEKPTARKLKDAREKGQVARSPDLANAASLAAVTIALAWLGARIASSLGDRLASALRGLGDRPLGALDPGMLAALFREDAWRTTLAAGPLLLVAAAVSAGASVAQVGWLYAPKALEWKWQQLSPAAGLKKFAPQQAGTELAKAMVGVLIVGALCYVFVRDAYAQAPLLATMLPADAMRAGWDQVWRLLWRVSLAMIVLGAGDYAIQRWRWYSQVKMTRQEVRDDAKHQEGSPEIRARVRRIQRDMTRRRMLQAVKKATVVITNPTHYAVALEYRRADMAAPVVVAKGQDLLAARIREVARRHGVPIVENVGLARALYRGADVGDAIPSALFGAVAEVLAYLVRLKQLIL